MRRAQPVDRRAYEHLYPFASHYLERRGLRHHYLDEGHGEPVVMLHGNPTWSFYFRSLVKALAPRYRTVVPDHIGCGLSSKPPDAGYGYRLQDRVDDLRFVLDALGIQDNITLVLHDWGGMIGMAFAVADPERIARLVVLNTAAFLPPPGKALPVRLRLLRKFPLLATPAVLGLNLFARAAIHMAPAQRLAGDVRAGMLAPYNSWANRLATLKFVQDIPLGPRDPSYALVAAVDRQVERLRDKPMLICWGQKDFIFDRDYFEEWRRRFPCAEAHLFPTAGHYLLEDVPEAVATHVAAFLKNNPIH